MGKTTGTTEAPRATASPEPGAHQTSDDPERKTTAGTAKSLAQDYMAEAGSSPQADVASDVCRTLMTDLSNFVKSNPEFLKDQKFRELILDVIDAADKAHLAIHELKMSSGAPITQLPALSRGLRALMHEPPDMKVFEKQVQAVRLFHNYNANALNLPEFSSFQEKVNRVRAYAEEHCVNFPRNPDGQRSGTQQAETQQAGTQATGGGAHNDYDIHSECGYVPDFEDQFPQTGSRTAASDAEVRLRRENQTLRSENEALRNTKTLNQDEQFAVHVQSKLNLLSGLKLAYDGLDTASHQIADAEAFGTELNKMGKEVAATAMRVNANEAKLIGLKAKHDKKPDDQTVSFELNQLVQKARLDRAEYGCKLYDLKTFVKARSNSLSTQTEAARQKVLEASGNIQAKRDEIDTFTRKISSLELEISKHSEELRKLPRKAPDSRRNELRGNIERAQTAIVAEQEKVAAAKEDLNRNEKDKPEEAGLLKKQKDKVDEARSWLALKEKSDYYQQLDFPAEGVPLALNVLVSRPNTDQAVKFGNIRQELGVSSDLSISSRTAMLKTQMNELFQVLRGPLTPRRDAVSNVAGALKAGGADAAHVDATGDSGLELQNVLNAVQGLPREGQEKPDAKSSWLAGNFVNRFAAIRLLAAGYDISNGAKKAGSLAFKVQSNDFSKVSALTSLGSFGKASRSPDKHVGGRLDMVDGVSKALQQQIFPNNQTVADLHLAVRNHAQAAEFGKLVLAALPTKVLNANQQEATELIQEIHAIEESMSEKLSVRPNFPVDVNDADMQTLKENLQQVTGKIQGFYEHFATSLQNSVSAPDETLDSATIADRNAVRGRPGNVFVYSAKAVGGGFASAARATGAVFGKMKTVGVDANKPARFDHVWRSAEMTPEHKRMVGFFIQKNEAVSTNKVRIQAELGAAADSAKTEIQARLQEAKKEADSLKLLKPLAIGESDKQVNLVGNGLSATVIDTLDAMVSVFDKVKTKIGWNDSPRKFVLDPSQLEALNRQPEKAARIRPFVQVKQPVSVV